MLPKLLQGLKTYFIYRFTTGYRIWDTEYRIQDSGYRIQDTKLHILSISKFVSKEFSTYHVLVEIIK